MAAEIGMLGASGLPRYDRAAMLLVCAGEVFESTGAFFVFLRRQLEKWTATNGRE
jgi:hypothetical protein